MPETVTHEPRRCPDLRMRRARACLLVVIGMAAWAATAPSAAPPATGPGEGPADGARFAVRMGLALLPIDEAAPADLPAADGATAPDGFAAPLPPDATPTTDAPLPAPRGSDPSIAPVVAAPSDPPDAATGTHERSASDGATEGVAPAPAPPARETSLEPASNPAADGAPQEEDAPAPTPEPWAMLRVWIQARLTVQ